MAVGRSSRSKILSPMLRNTSLKNNKLNLLKANPGYLSKNNFNSQNSIITSNKGKFNMNHAILADYSKKNYSTYNKNHDNTMNAYRFKIGETEKIPAGIRDLGPLHPIVKYTAKPSTETPPELSDAQKRDLEQKYGQGKKLPADWYVTKTLNGKSYPQIMLWAVMNHPSLQLAVLQLAMELKIAGVPLDGLPTNASYNLYGGSAVNHFIANTHGLREGDRAKAREAAATEFNKFKEEHPNGRIEIEVLFRNVRNMPEHKTLGKTSNPDSPLGGSMHAQLRLRFRKGDGETVKCFILESTAAPHHGMGKDWEILPVSYDAQSKFHPTDLIEPRTASKDGKKNLENVTVNLKQFSDNTNWTYVYEGEEAQYPPGHTFDGTFTFKLNPNDDQARESLAVFRLIQKGGVILESGNKIENPNKKFSNNNKLIDEILSIGSCGVHAQSGGQFMCMSFVLDILFGREGIMLIGEADKKFGEYLKPLRTFDSALSLIFHSMAAGATIIDSKGNIVELNDPEGLKNLFGERYYEYLRQDIRRKADQQAENQQAEKKKEATSAEKEPMDPARARKEAEKQLEKLVMELKAKVDGTSPSDSLIALGPVEKLASLPAPKKASDTVIVGGLSGQNIEIRLTEPDSRISLEVDELTASTLSQFIMGGKQMENRYGVEQQTRDFGRFLAKSLDSTEIKCAIDYFRELAKIWGLSENAIARVMSKLPNDET